MDSASQRRLRVGGCLATALSSLVRPIRAQEVQLLLALQNSSLVKANFSIGNQPLRK
jgi:hypothetical protein